MPPRRSARLLAKVEAENAENAENAANAANAAVDVNSMTILARQRIALFVNTLASTRTRTRTRTRNIDSQVLSAAQPDGSRRRNSSRRLTINHRVARFRRERTPVERPAFEHPFLDRIYLEPLRLVNMEGYSGRDTPPESANQTKLGVRRLQSEITKMQAEPTDGCQVELLGDSLYVWKAIIIGPSDTPYEGGHFELRIRFPKTYPCQPPSLQFRTKIYHCNIHHGFICMDILGSNWSAALTVEKLLLSIRSLLADPNPDSPMNCVVAEMYKKNRKQHDIVAREWTILYAQPGAPPSVILPSEKDT